MRTPDRLREVVRNLRILAKDCREASPPRLEEAHNAELQASRIEEKYRLGEATHPTPAPARSSPRKKPPPRTQETNGWRLMGGQVPVTDWTVQLGERLCKKYRVPYEIIKIRRMVDLYVNSEDEDLFDLIEEQYAHIYGALQAGFEKGFLDIDQAPRTMRWYVHSVDKLI